MYGNKNESQSVEVGVRGGGTTTIATGDTLPTCRLVTDGKKTWAVDEMQLYFDTPMLCLIPSLFFRS